MPVIKLTPAGQEPQRNSKTITFTGGANMGNAGENVAIFTVTGEIMVLVLVPFCTTNLTEAGATATISLGITNAVALFIAATDSKEIDANEFWVDTAPDPYGIALPATLKDIPITDNIVAACATQDTDGGVLRFDLYWMPLSSNGAVS